MDKIIYLLCYQDEIIKKRDALEWNDVKIQINILWILIYYCKLY